MTPIHPIAQADGLLALTFGKFEDALFTTLHELVYAIRFDIELGCHAKFLFDFNLDPEALTVKAVLIALLVTLHRFDTLVQVFISASPGMMNPHGVIRGDRTIQERKLLIAVLVAGEVHTQ